MSVKKFRDLESMRQALWTRSDDPTLPDRIRALWALSAEMAGLDPPRGVQRFRTIEEANAERDERTRKRMRQRAKELGLQ
ncbi:MAG: hypothetical protein ACYCW6_08075 [Candidatus Xenobia bacterium]